VTLKCPADVDHAPEERTVEFHHPGRGDPRDGGTEAAGGLINFLRLDDGTLNVCVYRCDGPVVVQVGKDVAYHLPLDARCVGTSPNSPLEVHGMVPLLRSLRELYGERVFNDMVALARLDAR
jgi:hypothetical protein